MNRKQELQDLVQKFDQYYLSGKFDETSEATARSWIEKLLAVFGWDASNPKELDQESRISKVAIDKMSEIDSTHKTPDYALMLNDEVLFYLDAKQTSVDIKNCKRTSFQVRAYGWSSATPIAIVTNFKELSIYDTRYKPDKLNDASVGRVYHFTYRDFISNFDVIDQHLAKENVQSRKVHDKYSSYNEPRGTKSLDQDFAEFLSDWRLRFAKDIFSKNKKMDIGFLQEQVQFLLDRVVFLRIAEGKRVEKHAQLKEISQRKDSYIYFLKECKTRFAQRYGGYLFDRSKIENLSLDPKLFSEFLGCFYFPFPYMFEVIPTELLGSMYEQYLGKILLVKSGKIIDDFKPEYQKQKGAVYTPRYIVNSICEETVSRLMSEKKIRNIRSVLNLGIIDPSCGSGSFLLGVYDLLAYRIKEIISTSSNLEKKYDSWFWIDPRRNKVFLKVKAKRHIINSCIYGIDIDSQAVEVSRLSLSLKALEGAEVEPSILELDFDEVSILDSIGENIKHGNSLVDDEIFNHFPDLKNDVDALDNLKIFNWETEFRKVFEEKNGFDAVVGNPPYVETKHFKKESPYLHDLLSLRSGRVFETAAGGKLDIAMPFIERGIKKLNENGRLGYIVTNRFFKTDYGKATREYLSRNKHVESVLDFGELKVFKGRSTYTSILHFTKKPNENLRYLKIDSLLGIENELPSHFADDRKWARFSYNSIGETPWNFSFPDLLQLTESLLLRFPKISQIEKVSIKVGLQVLFDKIYHFKALKVTDRSIYGVNGLGHRFEIERDVCRPLVCNENFYAFKDLDETYFCLFPYSISNGIEKDIDLDEMRDSYPKAYKYLCDNKKFIQKEVETIDDKKRWHLYTYKKNITSQAVPKVLFPSTIIDTVATVDSAGTFYQDNVRVNSLVIKNAPTDLYWAIASIFNSTLFNCLAKVTTNPLQEGHVQFNKQFIEPIPLPLDVVERNESLRLKLSTIGNEISALTAQLNLKQSSSKVKAIKLTLQNKWEILDRLVETEVYGLTKGEKETLNKYPRKEDRVEYFLKLNTQEAAS